MFRVTKLRIRVMMIKAGLGVKVMVLGLKF